MWGFSPDNWLKKLLLTHDNKTLTLSNPPPHIPAWLKTFHSFNVNQRKAFDRACYLTTNLSDRVTLLQGPPGTGKTGVISRCALDSLKQGQRFFIVAETHKATQANSERLQQDLDKAHIDDTGIWLLEHSGQDAVSFIVNTANNVDEGGLGALFFDFPDDDEIPMSFYPRQTYPTSRTPDQV